MTRARRCGTAALRRALPTIAAMLAVPAAGAQLPEAENLQQSFPGPRILDQQLTPDTQPDLAISVRGPGAAGPGETLRFEAELRNIGDARADLDQRGEDGEPIPIVQWTVLKPGQDLNDLFILKPGQDLNDLFVAGPGEELGERLDPGVLDADDGRRRTPDTDFGAVIRGGPARPDIGERLADGLIRGGETAEEGIIATETMLGGLEPGRSLRLRATYRVPAEPPGTYRICAAVDPEEVIAEADESRNIGCAEVHVGPRPDDGRTFADPQ